MHIYECIRHTNSIPQSDNGKPLFVGLLESCAIRLTARDVRDTTCIIQFDINKKKIYNNFFFINKICMHIYAK